MPTFAKRSPMPATAERLMAWHLRAGAFERLSPPWEDTDVVDQTGDVADGGTVTLRTRVAGVPRRWVAEHEPAEALRFRDRQVQGPFARWVHTHTMVPHGATSVLEDHVDYALPLGALGRLAAGRSVHRRLERLFAWRHDRMQQDLARSEAPPMTVAITGASGLLGSHLKALLQTQGHTPRGVPRQQTGFAWRPEDGIVEPKAWQGIDGVVHYAGESIAQRWTESAKRRIWESRVPATKRLCEGLAALDEPPRVLVSASAVGYYGDHPEVTDERGDAGEGFLAELCVAWEEAADPARDAGIRVVHPRTGLVLSAAGGALPPLLRATKLGAGGPITGGRQWWPWVHVDDHAYAVQHLLTSDVEGPVNIVAPGIVQQRDFQKVLSKVVHRPAIAPLPKPAVAVMFGQMGKELFTYGQHLRPRVLEDSGFHFARPGLEEALRFELGRPHPSEAVGPVA